MDNSPTCWAWTKVWTCFWPVHSASEIFAGNAVWCFGAGPWQVGLKGKTKGESHFLGYPYVAACQESLGCHVSRFKHRLVSRYKVSFALQV